MDFYWTPRSSVPRRRCQLSVPFHTLPGGTILAEAGSSKSTGIGSIRLRDVRESAVAKVTAAVGDRHPL